MTQVENINLQSPVVIGGLGGSGTRVVAEMLKGLNFYMGDYMNEQYDNLWFTFLFRRPQTFGSFMNMESKVPLHLFDSIMKNQLQKSLQTKLKLYKIGIEFTVNGYVKGRKRISFPTGCIKSILNNNKNINGNWGWKEPNSHLFIGPLAKYYPTMKFILVLRHPLDMAYGNNFLQLYNWHHLFNLPKPTSKNQSELMLSYYKAANARTMQLGGKLLRDNFMAIKLEDICENKTNSINRLVQFLGVEATEEKKLQLAFVPQSPGSLYRYKNFDWKKLPRAEEICERFDYAV